MKDKLFLQEELKAMLHKHLEGKNYFIILDDMWEREHWESLRAAFADEQDRTSRLLLTTRNKDIANYSQYAHEMKLLDPERSWELLLKKALIDKRDGKCIEELEPIGRKIVQKCGGLPLAINLIGGLLVGKQSKINGWEQVLNQINSHLGREESSVSAILELSYQNLSPQLKSCFLCLAFFKEDDTIPKKRLQRMWVGQGFFQCEERTTVEEMTEGYLDELINRNMIQIKDLSMDGRVKNYQLHDLVREVCLRKAKEEIGLEIIKGQEGLNSSCESSYKPRHLVVYGEDRKSFSIKQNMHLRSLFLLNVNKYYVGIRIPFHYSKSFQLLRTLDLDGFKLQRFSHSFRALIGLKYLRIRSSTHKTLKLPSWLDNLKKLEVVDMGWRKVKFPGLVSLKMERLRYFHAHIVRGPMRIDIWKSIECLKNISHKDWMRCSSSVMSSSRLSELRIRLDGWIEPQELSKVRMSLEKMQNLVILHLIGTFKRIEVALAIPHLPNLTKLKVTGMMVKCPAASMYPPNLSHLTLDTSFQNDPMAELGKLSKLLYLKLLGGMDERLHILHDAFPCLKHLTLRYMVELRGIYVEQGGMPHLKHLRIPNCPNLDTKNLPEHINISAE